MNTLMRMVVIGAAAAMPASARAGQIISFVPSADTGPVTTLTFGNATLTAFTYSATQIGASPTTIANAFGTLTVSSVDGYRATAATGSGLARGGVGVCSTGDGQCNQVDTTGTNELLNVAFNSGYRIISAVLADVDANDTVRLFGVSGNNLTDLGYANPALIASTGTSFGNGRYRVSFNPVAAFDRYIFANNNATGDGYRVQSIETAVPEPATWALMLFGFLTVGSVLRRRRPVRISFA